MLYVLMFFEIVSFSHERGLHIAKRSFKNQRIQTRKNTFIRNDMHTRFARCIVRTVAKSSNINGFSALAEGHREYIYSNICKYMHQVNTNVSEDVNHCVSTHGQATAKRKKSRPPDA